MRKERRYKMLKSKKSVLERSTAVELLRGLVAVPSLSGEERAASEWLVAQMEGVGYDRAYVDEAGNAVGEMGFADAPHTLVLLGHIDTVPGDIPVRIAKEDAGEVLYGRGSVDAKGPLATFAAAVAKAGAEWARAANVRVVVVGAVEEEAATSKGARWIAARFNGKDEPIPDACIIGEPSSWRRVTLGYKGRILVDLDAWQPMAHTAGPDRGVATLAVDLWNWIAARADAFNADQRRAFDQLLPSLRQLHTHTDAEMNDHVTARMGIRLPLDFDAPAFATEIVAWMAERIGAPVPLVPVAAPDSPALPMPAATVELVGDAATVRLHFRGHEAAWEGDRRNGLVRSFLGAIRHVDPDVRPGFVVKTGTSDMNVVAPLWQSPILAYGPGDSALDHTPNEHIELDEYWRAVLVLEQALRNWALNPRASR